MEWLKGKKPMTNYEKIKSMSIDEMADNLLGAKAFCPHREFDSIGNCSYLSCQVCIKKWLRRY